MTYDTTFRQHVCILIALTQKTNFNQANLNQVLAIFCQIDGFNRTNFFVHPCVIFYESLHANIMYHGIEKCPLENLKNKQVDVNS